MTPCTERAPRQAEVAGNGKAAAPPDTLTLEALSRGRVHGRLESVPDDEAAETPLHEAVAAGALQRVAAALERLADLAERQAALSAEHVAITRRWVEAHTDPLADTCHAGPASGGAAAATAVLSAPDPFTDKVLETVSRVREANREWALKVVYPVACAAGSHVALSLEPACAGDAERQALKAACVALGATLDAAPLGWHGGILGLPGLLPPDWAGRRPGPADVLHALAAAAAVRPDRVAWELLGLPPETLARVRAVAGRWAAANAAGGHFQEGAA